MPSGADLEYARMLAASGQTSGVGLDGARLEQLEDSISYIPSVASAGTDGATVGLNLITSDGWTLGSGWSGSLAGGFTKTAGGTGALTWTPPFTTSTKNYIVTVDVSTPTNNFLNYEFTLTLGNSFAMVMYEGEFFTHTYTRGIRSVSSGNLVFTPNSNFEGTVSGFTIREVGVSGKAQQVFKDSTGATVLEVRSTTPDLNNVFIGKNSGQSNVSGKENVVIGQNTMGVSTSGFWNAGVGFEVLRDNVNGTRNAALGFLALRENITGHRNIAIGPFVLTRNTHGIANIALGADSMWYNTTGNYNIAMGQASLGESVTGDANIAIGRAALGAANGLSNHIAIGDYAGWQMQDETVGNQIAIGRRSLRNATRGGNIGIGFEVGLGLTTGHGHTVIGHEALQSVTDALNCTVVGKYAARYQNGERNTAVGMSALAGNTGATGIRNTGIGYSALAAITSGARNVALGDNAGSTLTSGNDNIYIGYNVQPVGVGETSQLNIGNLIYGQLSGSTKRVGINVTNPTARLQLPAGTATASTAPLKFTGGGTLLTTPEIGAIEFTNAGLFFTDHLGVRKQFTLA